MEISEEERLRI